MDCDVPPQKENVWTRRHWLRTAGAVTAGMTLAPSVEAALPPDREPDATMPVGILLGTFGRATLEANLDAAKACELETVQLSMNCAGLATMPEEIPAEVAARIRRAAAARGITLASVDGTFNMSHPDAEQRRAGLRRLRVLAAACAAMGTSKIHVCTGTRDPNNMWQRHADNQSAEAWRDMIGCMREATEIARETNVTLAFEPEVNNVVDSAQRARQLMDEIGSPHLKVTMDGANIFHAGELARMSEILDEAFALVGKDIALVHAKDLSHDGDAGHEPAGHGKLDYDRYIALLRAYAYQGPILLHGLSEAQVPECVGFLRAKLARTSGPAPKR
jgi:sugar phosphate isomerase/epimerase